MLCFLASSTKMTLLVRANRAIGSELNFGKIRFGSLPFGAVTIDSLWLLNKVTAEGVPLIKAKEEVESAWKLVEFAKVVLATWVPNWSNIMIVSFEINAKARKKTWLLKVVMPTILCHDNAAMWVRDSMLVIE